MRDKLLRAIGALSFSALIGVASADLAHASPTFTVAPNSNIFGIAPFTAPCGLNGTQKQDCWEPESGQSMPTGVAGYLNGTVQVNASGVAQITLVLALVARPSPVRRQGMAIPQLLLRFGSDLMN